MGFQSVIEFTWQLQFTATGNYNSFIDLHTLQITNPDFEASVSSPGIAT